MTLCQWSIGTLAALGQIAFLDQTAKRLLWYHLAINSVPYKTIKCEIEKKVTNDPSFIGFRNERKLRKPYIWEPEVVFHYINLKWWMFGCFLEATGFQRIFLWNNFQFRHLQILVSMVHPILQDKIYHIFLRYLTALDILNIYSRYENISGFSTVAVVAHLCRKSNESPPLNRRSFEDIKVLFYRFDIDRLLWFFFICGWVCVILAMRCILFLSTIEDDNGNDKDTLMIILVLRYFDLIIITYQNRATEGRLGDIFV